jgi:hypothetical protein
MFYLQGKGPGSTYNKTCRIMQFYQLDITAGSTFVGLHAIISQKIGEFLTTV